MYSLKNNPVLLPHQTKILKSFFAAPVAQTFFLTGGTALAAFYFGHRESQDFDLFSIEDFAIPEVDSLINSIASSLGAKISVKVVSNTYREMYLKHEEESWIQRIDIVREQPRHFGEIVGIDGVKVDSLENIGSNKILTLFSRLEPKDYVDFYTIVSKTEFTFDALFELAKQKDSGLGEFYFAASIGGVDQIESWPKMKTPLDIKAMVDYYHRLAEELLLRVKPRES